MRAPGALTAALRSASREESQVLGAQGLDKVRRDNHLLVLAVQQRAEYSRVAAVAPTPLPRWIGACAWQPGGDRLVARTAPHAQLT